MDTNRLKVHVAGADIPIVTDDDPQYVYELGRKVDEDLKEIFAANPRIATTHATILLAMEYINQNKKAMDSISDLRGQIKDYLDDASNAKSKADYARREAEMLKKEAQVLRAENAKLLARIKELTDNQGAE